MERGVAHALDERSERGFGNAVTWLTDRRQLRRHDGRDLHVVETGEHDLLGNFSAEPRQRLPKPGRSLVVAADKGVGFRLRDELPDRRGVVRLRVKDKHLHPARLARGGTLSDSSHPKSDWPAVHRPRRQQAKSIRFQVEETSDFRQSSDESPRTLRSFAACRSFPEEVVERNFGLYVIPIRVVTNTIHGYHGKVNGIGRAGILYKSLATRLKLQVVLVVDGKRSFVSRWQYSPLFSAKSQRQAIFWLIIMRTIRTNHILSSQTYPEKQYFGLK